MSLAEPQVLARAPAVDGPDTTSGLPQDRFHPLPHVVSARAGNTMVLMDRERGTYHTLNEVSGRIWELVGDGAEASTIVERLLDEYDVSRQQLEADVAATLRQLVADRLIAPGVRPRSLPGKHMSKSPVRAIASSTELRVPSVLRCGLMIFALKVLLKTRGFVATLEWVRRRTEGVPQATAASVNLVQSAEHAVAMAGAFYPGRARCLEQSLVLYYVLRRRGVSVKYCQGVRPYPFQAHAWIEYHGVVINDVAEHAQLYARLPDQLP